MVKKLGLKEETTAVAVNAPASYATTLGELPEGTTIVQESAPDARFIHVFATSRAELEAQLGRLVPDLAYDGMLWISWPKKASKVETDLTGDVVRAVGLASGLVDVKVCAVDEVWSGLKFVYRLQDRPTA